MSHPLAPQQADSKKSKLPDCLENSLPPLTLTLKSISLSEQEFKALRNKKPERKSKPETFLLTRQDLDTKTKQPKPAATSTLGQVSSSAERLERILTTVESCGVHYNAKLVHSNHRACGFRVRPEEHARLPYFSTLRMLQDGVELPLDYTSQSVHQTWANAGTFASTALRLANRLLIDEPILHGSYKEVLVPNKSGTGSTVKKQPVQPQLKLLNTDDHQTLKKAMAGLPALQIVPETIDPRAKQLLMPDGLGGIIAITPLPSGPGVAAGIECFSEIKNRIRSARGQQDADSNNALRAYREMSLKHFKTVLSVAGGSNKQNASAFASAVNRGQLLFEGPALSPSVQAAFRAYYKGIDLKLPYEAGLLFKERLELHQQQPKCGQNLFKAPAEEWIETLLHQARTARNRIKQHAERLGIDSSNTTFVSKTLAPVQRGLIDPRLRTYRWADQLAQALMQQLRQYKIKGDLLSMDERSSASLFGALRERLTESALKDDQHV